MIIEQNKDLVRALREYMEAREMRRKGLVSNIHIQREYLRNTYRVIAGK